MRYYYHSSACSSSTQGSPTSSHAWITKTGSFWCKETMVLLQTTLEKLIFGRSLQSHSFSHYPKLAVTGEDWNDRLVNLNFCLLAQLPLHHKGLVECQHCFWRCPKWPVHLKLHFLSSFMSQAIRHLSSSNQATYSQLRGSHSSILSFSANQSQVTVWQARQGNLEDLLSAHFPALPRGSWGFPRPDEICHPSSEFWVCPAVSSQLVVPGMHPGGIVLDAQPPNLAPSDIKEQQLYSEVCLDALHPFWGHLITWKRDGALVWKCAPPVEPDLSGEVMSEGLVAVPCSMGLGQKKHRHNNMEPRPCQRPATRSEWQQDLVQSVPGGRGRWGPGHPDTWHRILVPRDRYTCLF